MKKLLFILPVLLLYHLAPAQQLPRVAYSINFDLQGFSLPFAKPKSYWQNKGVSFGLIYNWNRRGALQQTAKIGNFFNRYHGSSWHVSTATQFNPIHSKRITSGLYLGVGYMLTGSGSGSWQQQTGGDWVPSANKKGLLFLPVGVQAQVKAFENNKLIWSPTISYQVNALLDYTPKTLVLPQSLISVGSQFKFK